MSVVIVKTIVKSMCALSVMGAVSVLHAATVQSFSSNQVLTFKVMDEHAEVSDNPALNDLGVLAIGQSVRATVQVCNVFSATVDVSLSMAGIDAASFKLDAIEPIVLAPQNCKDVSIIATALESLQQQVNVDKFDGLADTRYFDQMAILTAQAGKPFTQTVTEDSGIKITMGIRFKTSYSESDPVSEPNT